MKKKFIAFLLVMLVSISLYPISAQAAFDYSDWNGCWVVQDYNGEKHYIEYAYRFNFDSLNMNWYSITGGNIGVGWVMTRVNEKTFTYQPASLTFTITINDNGTISRTAPEYDTPNGTVKATNEVLVKDNSYLVNFAEEFEEKDYSGAFAPFRKTESYNNTFLDVASGSWYESGVKSAYEAGIIGGVADGVFDPDGTVSMAQAITVASRVHAQYYNNTISKVSGAWYEMYSQYAKANKLLPPDVDNNTDLLQPATRAFMAYVFAHAIDSSDLSGINTAAVIADIGSVEPTYQDTVKLMYESGIITGMDDNKFNPSELATRAQMSVMIMRLIMPCERASSDPKIDDNFLKQQSNVMNHIPYYEGENKNSVALCGANDNSSTLLYRQNGEKYESFFSYRIFDVMIVGDDTYFVQDNMKTGEQKYENFVKYDPITRTSKNIFTIQGNINGVTLYDGVFYLLVGRYTDGLKFYTDVYSVTTDGIVKKLVDNIEGNSYLSGRIAVFNDTVIFNVGSSLFSYMIGSKQAPVRVMTSVSSWDMHGNTVYFTDYGGGVFKIAANYPGFVKLIGNFSSTTIYGRYINYSEGSLYIIDQYSRLLKCEKSECTLLSNKLTNAYNLGVFSDYICYNAVESYQFGGKFMVVQISDLTNIVTFDEWVAKQ